MCNNLQNIISFYADCENNLFQGDAYYGDGSEEVECECCTDCCSPGPQGECNRKGSPNLKKKQVTAAATSTSHESIQAVTVIKNLVLEDFGSPSPVEGRDTDYDKALAWIISDPYALDNAEILVELSTSDEKPPDPSYTSNHLMESILLRYFFSLLYFAMSGDQWKNCSALVSIDTPRIREYHCSYTNTEGDLISNKFRWLSPSRVCDWAGITCNSSNDQAVISIELSK